MFLKRVKIFHSVIFHVMWSWPSKQGYASHVQMAQILISAQIYGLMFPYLTWPWPWWPYQIWHTVCAIQFATKGIRYFGSLNTSRDSSNMLTTFSGHHSKVPDHLIQHWVHNEVIIAESLQNICIKKSTAHPF